MGVTSPVPDGLKETVARPTPTPPEEAASRPAEVTRRRNGPTRQQLNDSMRGRALESNLRSKGERADRLDADGRPGRRRSGTRDDRGQ